MHDPALVSGREAVGHLDGDRDRFGRSNRLSRYLLGEGFALDQFEEERGDAIGFLEAVDGGDVRMAERGEEAIGVTRDGGRRPPLLIVYIS